MSAEEITLDTVEFTIRGYFNRAGGRFAGVLNRGIEEIQYETRINSPETPEVIKALAHDAEAYCYVLATLRRAVRINGRILHNGLLLFETTHGPDE